MSDEKKSQRRRFSIDGESGERATTKRVKARPLADVFGLDQEEVELPDDGEVAVRTHSDQRMLAFMAGQITLGDLEGISKQEQYEMAKIGFSYLEGGKLEKAKTIFEGLIALDPFDAYFRLALAAIAQQEGRLSDAEEGYGRVLEINPFSATAYANRGEIRVMQGRLTEGAEDLIRAIQEDPKGAQDATLRARATLKVLQEQLSVMAEDAPSFQDDDAPGPRLKATPEPRPRPGRGPDTFTAEEKKAPRTAGMDTFAEKGPERRKSGARADVFAGTGRDTEDAGDAGADRFAGRAAKPRSGGPAPRSAAGPRGKATKPSAAPRASSGAPAGQGAKKSPVTPVLPRAAGEPRAKRARRPGPRKK